MRQLGIEGACPVADKRREPDHDVGAVQIAAPGARDPGVAENEVDGLQIDVLVEEQVVDHDVMAGLDCLVGQPSADIAGAANNENA